jgi:hypothetical protein
MIFWRPDSDAFAIFRRYVDSKEIKLLQFRKRFSLRLDEPCCNEFECRTP